MYNVVIAEDESIIREGLSRLIDWQEFGCEVVFLAEDGLAALRYIQSHPVDILITDIKMPRMNGLDLIKNVREINEDIVTFLVSGYGDFEYAKSAIQYSVSGYLLKPLEEEQLRDVILKAVSVLEKRAQRRTTEQDAQKINLKNMAMARERLFTKLFYSRTKIEAEPDLLVSLGLDDQTLYGAYLFEVTGSVPDETKERLAYFSEYVVLVEFRPDLWVLVVLGTDETEMGKQFGSFKSMLLKHNCRRSVVGVGSGMIYQGLQGLRRSFEEAVVNFNLRQSNALALRSGEDKITSVDLKERCDKIVNFVIQGREGLSAYLDVVEQELLMTGAQCIENANVLLGGVYARIVNTLLSREDYVDADALIKLYSCYEKAVNAIEVRRKIQILEELLEEVSTLFEVSAKGKWAKEINMAIAYIEKNYYKRTMDVSEIAEHVGMSPRYFSMIFKEKVGKSVMKYLIEYRVNIAKQLLLDKDLKAYQVAEMVGYDSYPYFSTLFRKVTGENPGTYSERMRAINADTHL